MMRRLTADAVRLARLERRRHRAWVRRQAEFAAGLADGSIDADRYSAAELHAFTTADSRADVPRLIADWEAFEAMQVVHWEGGQLGEALAAERLTFQAAD